MKDSRNQSEVSGIVTPKPPQTGWVDRPIDGYAHIYSDGTNVSLLFDSREDYIFGMNVLAVTAFQCDVTILVMQVMGTFIL